MARWCGGGGAVVRSGGVAVWLALWRCAGEIVLWYGGVVVWLRGVVVVRGCGDVAVAMWL